MMNGMHPVAATLLVLAVGTWILAVPRWVERISLHSRHGAPRAPRLGCTQHHLLHLVALALFAVVVPLGLLAVDWVPTAPAVDSASAGTSFNGMGKFPDLLEPVTGSNPAWPFRVAGLSLGLVWLTGAVLCLRRIARHWRRATQILDRADRVTEPALIADVRRIAADCGWSGRLDVRVSDEIASPFVWGPPGTTLVLTPDALASSPDQLRMLMIHEMTHVRRLDAVTALLAQLSCAIFWFHPLVWSVARRLEQLQELHADSRVLRHGVRPSDYGDYLLQVARAGLGLRAVPRSTALSILGDSPLSERVRLLLDGRPAATDRRPSFVRMLAVLMLIAAPVLVVPAWPALAAEVRSLGKNSDSVYETLDRALNPLVINKLQDYHVAGAAVAVVHGGEIVYSKGFGRAEVFENRQVDPTETIWRIGSVSKVMTGIAVMQLVDRGLLQLDADVNDYLGDDLRLDDTFPEPVRVRHLLTHTAGFDQLGYGRHAEGPDDVQTPGEFLVDNLVRIRPPGDVTCYDTYAITLAGHLVEKLSGLTFEEYLIRHVFEPLEMYRSGIHVPPALRNDTAVGYEFRGEWFPQDWESMNTAPASTVNSTVEDMGRFLIMLLQQGEYRGRRVLSEASVRAMLTQQHTNHPDLPGFGLTFWEGSARGVPSFSHGGSMTGYSSYLWLAPQHDLGVFIAHNQESGQLLGDIIRRIVETVLPDEITQPAQRPDWDGPVDLARFTGTWVSNMHNHSRPERGGWRPRPFDLTADEEGRLLFRGRPARPVGPLLFQRDDGLLLAFRESDAGEITHLFVEQTTYERPGHGKAP